MLFLCENLRGKKIAKEEMMKAGNVVIYLDPVRKKAIESVCKITSDGDREYGDGIKAYKVSQKSINENPQAFGQSGPKGVIF